MGLPVAGGGGVLVTCGSTSGGEVAAAGSGRGSSAMGSEQTSTTLMTSGGGSWPRRLGLAGGGSVRPRGSVIAVAPHCLRNCLELVDVAAPASRRRLERCHGDALLAGPQVVVARDD